MKSQSSGRASATWQNTNIAIDADADKSIFLQKSDNAVKILLSSVNWVGYKTNPRYHYTIIHRVQYRQYFNLAVYVVLIENLFSLQYDFMFYRLLSFVLTCILGFHESFNGFGRIMWVGPGIISLGFVFSRSLIHNFPPLALPLGHQAKGNYSWSNMKTEFWTWSSI